MPLSTLQDPVQLSSILKRYELTFDKQIPVASASQWSIDYFCIMIPAVMATAVLVNGVVDLRHGAVRLLLDDYIPLALQVDCLYQPQDSVGTIADELLRFGVVGVVDSMADLARVPRKTLWTNFVIVWDALFSRLAQLYPRNERIGEAQSWLDQAEVSMVDLRLQLRDLQTPYKKNQPSLRATCCLRYQLFDAVDRAYCEACPQNNN